MTMLSPAEKALLVRLLRKEKRRFLLSRESKKLVNSALNKLEQNLRNIRVNKLDKEPGL